MENQQADNQEVVETEVAVKTYTEEELQAESDRKVSKALETSKAKWQEEFKAQLEAEKSEAAKLASLSETERLQAEYKKKEEEWEAERQGWLNKDLESQTIKILSTSGLPIEFSKFVMDSSAEAIQANITELSTQWTTAIEAAVNERLNGKTPKASNKDTSTMTKHEFGKLDPKTRKKMYDENPDLIKQLK